jgi:hypothetical protein
MMPSSVVVGVAQARPARNVPPFGGSSSVGTGGRAENESGVVVSVCCSVCADLSFCVTCVVAAVLFFVAAADELCL